MSKTNTFEADLLEFIFNGTAIPNLPAATDLYASLHTADPGEAGDQTTNEAAYTSYARVAVARSGAGWTVSGGSVSPGANIEFPQATGGSETITHFGIGTASSGAGYLMYKGTVTPNLAVSNGVTPSLTTATAVTED